MDLCPKQLTNQLVGRFLRHDGLMRDLSPHEVMTIASALARLRHPAPSFFFKIAAFVEEKTEHFDTRDLAWTLWSLTQMGQDVNISQSFRLEEWKLRELNPSDASRLHCALATMLTSTEVQHR